MNTKTEIRKQNGYCDLLVNNQTITPMTFTSMREKINPSYLERLGKAGIKLFFLVCDLPWLEQPGLDIADLEKRLEELRKAVPGVKVILRVNLHPPLWWIEKNPDELVRLENNELLRVKYLSYYYREENVPVYSLVSDKWRTDAGKELEKLIALIDKMPTGDTVIGYFMGAGSTAEWGQCGLGQGIDHGKAFKQHFSNWLRLKYKTKEDLRQAWGQTEIDFNNITIPSLQEKSGHYNGGTYECNHFDEDIKSGKNKYALGDFIDPDMSFAAIDFLLAMHHGIAESIEHFCRIAKEFSNGKLLTGAFHGELLQAGTRKILLESEYIDFLATPGIYTNRMPGAITDIRCPSESYALHNKIFIMEDDTRTHLAAPVTRERYKSYTVEDSITQMKRDFGRNLCRNLHGWWFDMHLRIPDELWWMATRSLANGGSSWYDSPEILELMKQQQQIAELSLKRDRRRISSIAVIMDESSTLLGAHSAFLDSINWRCSELARIGAPVDFYYCDDLDNPDVPEYKLYIFLNTFMLNDKQRQIIKRKVRKNNSTVLWLHASGVCNQDEDKMLSHVNIEDLSGIKMRHDPQSIETEFNITVPTHDIVSGYDINLSDGRIKHDILLNQKDRILPANEPNYQMPNFYPEDDNADILGRFTANHAPALAYRDFGTWQSVYCSSKYISSSLLRTIARNAGCHIVCDSDDFIFMNNSYINIHAASDGNKTLTTGTPCSPVELYTGRKYGENISEFTFEMKKGETLTFSI